MKITYIEEIISWGIYTNSRSEDAFKHYFTFITGDLDLRATTALSYFSPGFSPDTGVGGAGTCFKKYETRQHHPQRNYHRHGTKQHLCEQLSQPYNGS